MASPEYGDAQATTQGGISTNERRAAALTAHLEREAKRGFVVETRSDTQAIVVRRRSRFARLVRPKGAARRVLSVDENGEVTARTATPVRW